MVYLSPPSLPHGTYALRRRSRLPRWRPFSRRTMLDPYEDLVVDKRVFPTKKSNFWQNSRTVVVGLIIVLFLVALTLIGLAS